VEQDIEVRHKIWPLVSPTDKKYIMTTMGVAVFYTPFFFIGHLHALLTDYAANGYSYPYQLWLMMGAPFYLLLGFVFLRKVLIRFFSEWTVAIVLLGIFLGTNLFHYSTHEGLMSHVYSFTLFSAFILLTLNWYDKPDFKNSILLGIVSGLITLIRPTNVVIGIFFLLYAISSPGDLKNRLVLFFRKFHFLALMCLAALLIWLPQLMYWKYIAGSWFFFGYVDSHFYFNNPQIINGLFSFRSGWLIYTPLMFFSLIGLLFLKFELKRFLLPTLAFLVINIYIVFSWWSWWYGGSFGLRAMIESYALLSIPFGAFVAISISRSRILKWSVLAFISLLIALNLFQTMQYLNGSIHFNSMTRQAYFASFLRLHPPPGFHNLLEEPDIDLARKGIHAIIGKPEIEIIETVGSDLETITSNGEYFISHDKLHTFGSAIAKSQKMARSGNNSIRLDASHPFGLKYKFHAQPDESYLATVWYKSLKRRHKATLVIASDDHQQFYASTETSTEVDDKKWRKFSFSVTIPETTDSLFVLYVWNASEIPVFFDDISLSKIRFVD
jgi:hypothetical protein